MLLQTFHALQQTNLKNNNKEHVNPNGARLRQLSGHEVQAQSHDL